MSRTDVFDLGRLRLTTGEGRRLDLEVDLQPLSFSGQRYEVVPTRVPVRLDLSRMTGGGWSMRLRFEAAVHGPCMRCLADAEPLTQVDAREVDQPGGGEELDKPLPQGRGARRGPVGQRRLRARAARPGRLPPDCKGLCPVCGENLNEAAPDHHHEAAPDPRWAALRELKFDDS